MTKEQKEFLQSVADIKNKLQDRTKFESEEATKNGLILPMIAALGYNVFNTEEVLPEAVADVGSKRGERVDYAIKVDGETKFIIECKQLNAELSMQHINQLYRYFTSSDVQLAVLTNGKDYLLFTDSVKKNIMDIEPFKTIRIESCSDKELLELLKYSKNNIHCNDIAHDVMVNRYVAECNSFIDKLFDAEYTQWIAEKLQNESSCDIGLDEASYILHDLIMAKVRVDRSVKELKTADAIKDDSCVKFRKDSSKASSIQIGKEYVFNDYSDGNWMFHSLGYAKIFGQLLEEPSGADVLCKLVEIVASKSSGNIDVLIEKVPSIVIDSLTNQNSSVGKIRYIDELLIGVQVKLGWNDIVKSIQRILDLFGFEHSEVIFNFRK